MSKYNEFKRNFREGDRVRVVLEGTVRWPNEGSIGAYVIADAISRDRHCPFSLHKNILDHAVSITKVTKPIETGDFFSVTDRGAKEDRPTCFVGYKTINGYVTVVGNNAGKHSVLLSEALRDDLYEVISPEEAMERAAYFKEQVNK